MKKWICEYAENCWVRNRSQGCNAIRPNGDDFYCTLHIGWIHSNFDVKAWRKELEEEKEKKNYRRILL